MGQSHCFAGHKYVPSLGYELPNQVPRQDKQVPSQAEVLNVVSHILVSLLFVCWSAEEKLVYPLLVQPDWLLFDSEEVYIFFKFCNVKNKITRFVTQVLHESCCCCIF